MATQSEIEMERRDPTEEEEGDDDESESEEEVEPKLKYDRLYNDLTTILKKDAASSIAVHSKFLALGTHWGMIFILDHTGNNIRDKEIMAHTTTVNQISIDDKGEYLASCSDDGKVIIAGLYGTELNQTVSFDRPVKSVGIDPFFTKQGRGRQCFIGEEKLYLNEKSGLFRSNKSTTIHSGEGPIRNMKWRGEFLAWANNIGVRVWDTSARCLISRIEKDHSYRPELYGCQLSWKDDRTLLVGWGDQVKVCVVKEQMHKEAQDRPRRYVEITALFKTDFYICGIAPLGDNLVILSYDLDGMQQESGRMVCKRPHLQIVEPGMHKYEEISNDALSIRGFEEYRVSDYHLECMPEENLFFIVSPKDIVVAKLRDMDDHISWLMEHERYEEAMACASDHEKELKTHTYEAIGRAYLDYLLEDEQYAEAVKMCPKFVGKRKDLWEEQIYKFVNKGQLQAIAMCIPTADPVLSPSIYEMVLYHFLQSDYALFYQLIKTWPHELYNKEVMVNSVVSRLDKDPDQELLIQSLGQLYAYQKAFDKALAIYLRLRNKDVFALIQKHSLYKALSDQIKPLMALDSEQATKLLLENVDKVPVSKVVDQLSNHTKMLYVYLDQVFTKDVHAAGEYGELMVGLYGQYDRSKLLAFLRRSESYPLQKALEICEERGYVKEQVFLLGRMGNLTQALKMIMEGLGDVDHAIEFCKEQNDEELWENLIAYSIGRPNFITALLHNVGADIDPIMIISRIQNGLSIPGLRDSLVKILQDYNLQISLREGCRKILVADSFNLLERMVKTQRKAILIDDSQSCPVCSEQVFVTDVRYASNLVVFHCRHAFHEDCLPMSSVMSCTICSSQKRGPGLQRVPR
ncbi:vacuolar protein sorting-associated protein 41 homolog [Babylonia areolata]|uniref:vacuolar protein sorting-associated protein 41 homolog n=1 Tax=Babylonia areolata TaxID=304850 RepID=UPI003FCFC844